MRLKVTFSCKKIAIPLSYQYYLAVAFYEIIKRSSKEFSNFLHDVGFKVKNKVFKYFCFSELFPKNSFVKNNILYIDGLLNWIVSSPLKEIFFDFLCGIMKKNTIYIENTNNKLVVEKIEKISTPRLGSEEKFIALSPIVVSSKINKNGKTFAKYHKADEKNINDLITNNLRLKYIGIRKEQNIHCLMNNIENHNENCEISCEIDRTYIERRGGADKVSKLITIKKGTVNEHKIKGFKCPLTLRGDPELINLAYNYGIGEKNSIGFGMIELINNRNVYDF